MFIGQNQEGDGGVMFGGSWSYSYLSGSHNNYWSLTPYTKAESMTARSTSKHLKGGLCL